MLTRHPVRESSTSSWQPQACFLQLWSQQNLGASWKCRLSGPSPDQLDQVPRGFSCPWEFEKHWPVEALSIRPHPAVTPVISCT